MGRDASDGNGQALIEPRDDGLALPTVGRWSVRKYHFLERYLRTFSTGMKDLWPNRQYIDLFAGAGLVRLRGSEEVVCGSPVLAANVPDSFTAIHCCEQDPEKAAALQQRLLRANLPVTPRVVVGDANECIDELLEPVPQRNALCVTFADPYGLHLSFDTLRRVAERRSDLIILLADNMDALRNWAKYYFDNPESNLDQHLGMGEWRERFTNTPSDGLAVAFREAYIEQLRDRVGYSHFGSVRVQNSQGVDIYTLVYAARHERGLDFWNKACAVDEGGQRSFDWS